MLSTPCFIILDHRWLQSQGHKVFYFVLINMLLFSAISRGGLKEGPGAQEEVYHGDRRQPGG